jgi:ribonuclease Z
MQVVILGSGSAVPDPVRGNPSQAIVIDDTILLFDCGERTTVNLTGAGINPLDVDYLFFTHLHWDHMCDYGYFVMTTWNCGRQKPVKVFGPGGTQHMSDSTIFGSHKADVDYVRQYIQALPPHIKERPQPSPAIEVQEIDEGFEYSGEDFRVIAGRVEHHQRVGMPSVGYRVECAAGVVAISGDTAPCDSMIELARGADVLIHDTAFLDEIIEERQMWSHSGPSGAGKVAEAAGVGKLVLTHLGPYTSPQAAVDMASMYYGQRRTSQIWEKIVSDAARYYSGPIVLGQDCMVIDVAGKEESASP